MSSQASNDYNEALRDFREKIAGFTLIGACGRPYILVSKLTHWLENNAQIHFAGQQINTRPANRLLQAAYRRRSGRPAPPMDVGQLCSGQGRCLLVFCILLELGLGDKIYDFWRKEKADSSLPLQLYDLKETFAEIDNSNDTEEHAKRFDKLQWRFCPARFDLNVARDFWVDRVLPICIKQLINTKGGTADLWQIAVLEEFVGKELREAAKNSKYDSPDDDSLGPVSTNPFLPLCHFLAEVILILP
jgi:hypothetical protein